MTCGHTKHVTGAAPLVCNLDAGHDGLHGVRVSPTLPPYVRWPVPWTEADERALAQRHEWVKTVKRRVYRSAAQAAQELAFANERKAAR